MAERAAPNTVLVSLLAGLTGAGVALLFAPRSGQQTRERLKYKASDVTGQAKEGLQAAKDAAGDKLEDARELKDRLATAIGNTGRKAKQEIDELRDDTMRESSSKQSSVLTNWEEEV